MVKKDKLVFIAGAVYFVALAALTAVYITLNTPALKFAASAVFLAGALAFTVICRVRKNGGYAPFKYLALAAAALCFAGDVAIEYNFVAGMALFGLGHVLYIAAFCALNQTGWGTVLPAAALMVFALCWLMLYPSYDFGALLPAVVAYAVVICIMLGRACGVALDGKLPAPLRAFAVCGAALFVVSDFFLTLRNFAGGGDAFRILCLSTYYPAQFLLTLCIPAAALSGGRRLKEEMNVFKRLYCRAFQAIFKTVIPFLPYRQPKPLGGSKEAADLLVKEGKRKALIVTDANIYKIGLCSHIQDALNGRGIGYCVYSDTVANPTTANCAAAAELFRAEGCDCLIAVGGGSAMDCAKGAGALISHPRRTLQSMRGVLKVFGKLPLFIAVPTTAGTGSETTIAAVITDDKTRDKFTVISFCLAPHYAILDPEMTMGLPPSVTSTTGMDALTHAVEAYIGGSTTRLTRRLSVEAVSLIRENLYAAYADGKNAVARKNMQYAAYKAGLAFTISYVGYVHAVAHSLGGKYNTPHGLANAVILPYVLKDYGIYCRKRLARLARGSGVASPDLCDKDAADEFIRFVEELNRKMNIPEKLKVEEGDIKELARHADREANPLYPVPRLMNAEALGRIYYEIKE